MLYSIVFGSAALWAWISYFAYSNSTEEHLLPSIVLNIVTLPSSLLMEKLVVLNPWLLNSSVSLLSLVTTLGFFQVLLVWLLAKWSAKRKREHL
jgi:hypothetical protein